MDTSSDDIESGNSVTTDAAADDAGSALMDDAGKSSDDLMARIKDRLRAVAEGDRTAYAEVIEASGRHVTQQELDDFDSRGGAPLVAAMRQHEYLLGDVAPESTLGQRWEQWQKDVLAADNGDRDAFIRASQANGVAPSAEDLAGFDLRGGPPVFLAARRQQMWGTFDPDSKLGHRLDQAMEDRTRAQQGDVEAARRLEVQTGHPPGAFAGADGSGGGQDPAEADRGGFDWLQPAPGGGTGWGPDVGAGPEPEISGGTKLGDVHDSDVGPGSDPGEWNEYPSNTGVATSPAPLVQADAAPARPSGPARTNQSRPASTEPSTTSGDGSGSQSSADFAEEMGTTIVSGVVTGVSSETYHSDWRSDGSERRVYADGRVESRDPEGNVVLERPPEEGTPDSEASTDSDTNTNEGTTDDDDAEADEEPEDEDDADTEDEEGGAAARTGAAEESGSLPDRVGIGALQDSPSGYVDRLTDYGPGGAPQHGAGDGADVRLPSRDPIALYGDGDARPGTTGETASGFVDPLTDYGPGGAPRHDYGPGDVQLPSHGTDQDPRAAGDGLGSIARRDGSALTQASLEIPGQGSLVGLAGTHDAMDFESSTLFDLSHETAGLEVHHDSFATVADMSLDLHGPPEANGAGGLDWLDDD